MQQNILLRKEDSKGRLVKTFPYIPLPIKCKKKISSSQKLSMTSVESDDTKPVVNQNLNPIQDMSVSQSNNDSTLMSQIKIEEESTCATQNQVMSAKQPPQNVLKALLRGNVLLPKLDVKADPDAPYFSENSQMPLSLNTDPSTSSSDGGTINTSSQSNSDSTLDGQIKTEEMSKIVTQYETDMSGGETPQNYIKVLLKEKLLLPKPLKTNSDVDGVSESSQASTGISNTSSTCSNNSGTVNKHCLRKRSRNSTRSADCIDNTNSSTERSKNSTRSMCNNNGCTVNAYSLDKTCKNLSFCLVKTSKNMIESKNKEKDYLGNLVSICPKPVITNSDVNPLLNSKVNPDTTSNPEVNMELVPGSNSGLDQGVNSAINPVVKSEMINTGENPDLDPGGNPGVNPAVNTGLMNPSLIPFIITPAINPVPISPLNPIIITPQLFNSLLLNVPTNSTSAVSGMCASTVDSAEKNVLRKVLPEESTGIQKPSNEQDTGNISVVIECKEETDDSEYFEHIKGADTSNAVKLVTEEHNYGMIPECKKEIDELENKKEDDASDSNLATESVQVRFKLVEDPDTSEGITLKPEDIKLEPNTEEDKEPVDCLESSAEQNNPTLSGKNSPEGQPAEQTATGINGLQGPNNPLYPGTSNPVLQNNPIILGVNFPQVYNIQTSLLGLNDQLGQSVQMLPNDQNISGTVCPQVPNVPTILVMNNTIGQTTPILPKIQGLEGSNSQTTPMPHKETTKSTEDLSKLKKKSKRKNYSLESLVPKLNGGKIIIDSFALPPIKTKEEREKKVKARLAEIGDQLYKCGICTETFNNASHFEIHVREHQLKTNNYILCAYCQKLLRKGSITDHMKSVHDLMVDSSRSLKKEVYLPILKMTESGMQFVYVEKVERYECNLCGDLFRTSLLYQNHKTRCFKVWFVCVSCRNKVPEKTEGEAIPEDKLCSVCKLRKILKSNKTKKKRLEKRHKCEDCGISYNRKKVYEDHIKSMHGQIMLYKCELCGKGYATRASMSAHMSIHKSVIQLCDICGARFKDLGTLTKHKKHVHNPKEFACETCGKRFAFQHHLKYHIKTHTEEKSYLCEVCGKSFHCKNELNHHEVVHKPKKKKFYCETCEVALRNENTLRQHEIYHKRMGTDKDASKKLEEGDEEIDSDSCNQESVS